MGEFCTSLAVPGLTEVKLQTISHELYRWTQLFAGLVTLAYGSIQKTQSYS